MSLITFCTLLYDAKVSFKFQPTEMEPLLLFYHMSFEGKARLSWIENGSQILECHWYMESQGDDHQLRHNIMIVNLKVYYAFQAAT
jgi:hypothetical protein